MRLLYEALLGLRLCRIDPYKRPAVTRIRGRRRVKRVPVKLAVLLCCAARRGKRATPLRCSRAQACGARQSATSVHQCHTAHGLVGNRGGNYSLALQRRRQAARGHHRGALPTGGGALISAGGRGQACELCAWRTGCVEAAAGWPGSCEPMSRVLLLRCSGPWQYGKSPAAVLMEVHIIKEGEGSP